MNKDYLEALSLVKKTCELYIKSASYLIGIDIVANQINEALNIIQNRLETIDQSNPNKALELIDSIREYSHSLTMVGYLSINYDLDVIQETIIKEQKREKMLDIIKEYQVDIWLLKQCDYENYIRIRKEATVSIGQIVNENGIILEDEITEEYFNLLKRWVDEKNL